MSRRPVELHGKRAKILLPRKHGYSHRPIVAVVDGIGITEHGEVIDNLASFALTDPHVWVTHDPTELLNYMLEYFRDFLAFTLVDSRDPDAKLFMNTARVTSFGFMSDTIFSLTYSPGRKKARHTVWQPTRMFSTPGQAASIVGRSHNELLKFATDIRAWCKENNLPLRGTLPSIAATLMRDKRFWPESRGRVPRATNERLRPFLPGVYQERRHPTSTKVPDAISLDQSRAYHRAAQSVPLPDGTNLYARGFFNDPQNYPELWAPVGSELFERTISQPGIVAIVATSGVQRKGQWRAPFCSDRRRTVRYMWTNEYDFAIRNGVKIEGIVAAWTSENADSGMPLYGKWAEQEIDKANDYRRQWLKPTLHSVYGLLGSRPRDLLLGHSHGNGEPEIYTIRGHAYFVKETRVSDNAPPATNVAALGVLQSEIRKRTFDLANHYGENVLHVHADGLHLANVPLEFLPPGWTAEPITNLIYLDDVSWLTDERDVLPGRDSVVRANVRRQVANTILASRKSARNRIEAA